MRRYTAHGQRVESRVGPDGGEAALLAPREAGRVEDDKVEAAALLDITAQQFETVGGDKIVPSGVQAVECDIRRGCLGQALTDVGADDRAGAAAQRVERERPGVGEAVQ